MGYIVMVDDCGKTCMTKRPRVSKKRPGFEDVGIRRVNRLVRDSMRFQYLETQLIYATEGSSDQSDTYEEMKGIALRYGGATSVFRNTLKKYT